MCPAPNFSHICRPCKGHRQALQRHFCLILGHALRKMRTARARHPGFHRTRRQCAQQGFFPAALPAQRDSTRPAGSTTMPTRRASWHKARRLHCTAPRQTQSKTALAVRQKLFSSVSASTAAPPLLNLQYAVQGYLVRYPRNSSIAAVGSCARNTAVPATKISAPFSRQSGAVSALTPPSTSSSRCG